MVFITKEIFFDMLDKKVLTQQDKQWTLTSAKKKSARKKRYVSEDAYQIYQNLLKNEKRTNA